jgi:hypothetical protein
MPQSNLNDEMLAKMAIPDRNAYLDKWVELAAEEAEMAYWESVIEAEQRNERWFEERGGGYYAGSEEEARDRFYDSLREEGF